VFALTNGEANARREQQVFDSFVRLSHLHVRLETIAQAAPDAEVLRADIRKWPLGSSFCRVWMAFQTCM